MLLLKVNLYSVCNTHLLHKLCIHTMLCLHTYAITSIFIYACNTPRQKSIRALEIFRVQKLILNATS